jgi:general secretion pathway protein G
MKRGFTLIELLIVVAIIGILSAIAIPNFLQAQTRAKVSRVKAEMSTIATALESYAVDYNKYPPQDGGVGLGSQDRLIVLTTPIEYISNAHLVDPFAKYAAPITGSANRYYKFRNLRDLAIKKPADYHENCKTYEWGVFSCAPDCDIIGSKKVFDKSDGSIKLESLYDPTNGVISPGDICRTQKGLAN